MDFEQTLKVVDQMDPQDGFSPADLLDFPSPIVSTLRFMMGKRKKEISALTTQLDVEASQLALLLEALAEKGLLIKSKNRSNNELPFVANLK